MQERLSKKEWLDYINRLQERERQKIMSGGLNNWTIIATIGGLAYWIFPESKNIKDNMQIVLLGFILINNLTVSIFDFFNTKYRIREIIKLGTSKTELGLKIKGLLSLCEYIVCIISIIGSLYLIFNNSLFKWNILIFLILRHLPPIITPIIIKSKEEALDSEILNKAIILRMRLTFFLISLSIYPFFYVFFFMDLDIEQLKFALYSLIFVLIQLMLQYLFLIFAKRLKIKWLEELERDIVLSKISNSAVQNRLDNEFFKLSKIDDYF